jgi:Protein of unknown function (DUF4127)
MTNKTNKNLLSTAFVGGLMWLLAVAAFAQNQPKPNARILLIPLDDRPPCLQFPVRMGAVGDAEIVAPPRELLGRFTEFGKPDEIIAWIKKQNLKSFDAVIVSVDMLAYGGLVAMRVHETDDTAAERRVGFVREMRKLAPKLKIYGSSVIMRLAPTGSVVNEAYRENLAKWAEISVDETRKPETAKLEKLIPAEALDDYRAARARDLKINRASIELVRDKVFDYLILSQDDAKPKGVHVADRENLIGEIKRLNLSEKIAVQPGADEVSMLLLGRVLTDKYNYRPKIKAIYSSEAIADQFMPYEDRPLRQTVSFHIKAVGATEVAEEKDADILFYVFVSRFENGKAEEFANEIHANYQRTEGDSISQIWNGKGVIVADVDYKGDIQGADAAFTEALKNKALFQKLSGYASWNTAGNTIGTALPQGVLYSLIQAKFGFNERKWETTRTDFNRRIRTLERVQFGQHWFMLNRLFDDYIYHSVVRPQAIKYAKDKGWNVFRFNDEETKAVEQFSFQKVKNEIRPIMNRMALLNVSYGDVFVCEDVKNYNFSLPWGRTFEAEIDFRLDCKKLDKPKVKSKKL